MDGKATPIRKNFWRGGWSLVLLSALVGVPQAWAKQKNVAPGRPIQLVWPLPPETPRIKFVAAIYRASDVEPMKKANFLDRVAGIQKTDFKPTFEKPYGIATDSHNRIYVTDTMQGIVFVLDRDNKKVTYIGSGSQVSLRLPVGIAVDAKDRVWVADAGGQHVYAFDTNGNALMALGKPGEMANPSSVAVDDARHHLYVVDTKQHCVLVYDLESGAYLAKFGERGLGKGQFNFPTNLAVDRQGRIYVADTMNSRIQIFDPQYQYVDMVGERGNKLGQFLKPKGLALDRYQNLYVVDSDFDNFQIFDQQKHLLMFLGTAGQVPGTFWLPAGICIDRNNYIYVADQANRRIQIFQLLNGETVAPPSVAIAAGPQPAIKGGDSGLIPGSESQRSFTETKKEKPTP
jgi:DNA-binding beta-propeller fold protein YncE